MNKIFATCLYRPRNDDYWGFCLDSTGTMLFEASDKYESTLKQLFEDRYFDKEIIFVDQFKFDEHEDFKKARMQSMHKYVLFKSE